MKILCIGDSNTWGYVPLKGKRYEQRWPKLLAKIIPGAEVIEAGLNGRTISQEEASFPERNGLKTLPAILENSGQVDKIIIMLGTNELKSSFALSAENIAEHLNIYIEEIINFYKNKFNSLPEIICISPTAINKNFFNNEFVLSDFNEESYRQSLTLGLAFKKMLSRNYPDIKFLDLHKEGVESSSKDGIHLEKEGHEKIASLLGAIIK